MEQQDEQIGLESVRWIDCTFLAEKLEQLPRGNLAGAGLQHLAHDDVIDLIRPDARALKRLGDRDAAKLAGRLAGEGPEQAAYRGPRATDNDGLTWFAHAYNDT